MLNQYYFYMILAQGREAKYCWALLISTFMQTSVNLTFLKSLGIPAAAWGMVVMGITLHFGQVFLLDRKEFEKHEVIYQEMFLTACALILGLLIYLDLGLWISSASGIFAIAILSITLVMKRADWKIITGWVHARL